MTDYLNPSHIPYANSCVSCGAEMGEGNQVCPACISTTQESLQVDTMIYDLFEAIEEGKIYTLTKRNGQLVIEEGAIISQWKDWREGV
jgi:uncharacterized OB-fold protein